MPAGLMPTEGVGEMCEYILKRPIVGVLPWQLRLFKNNLTPSPTTVLANLVEADFPGYVRATLDRDAWTVPTVSGGCAVSTWGTVPLEWLVTGGPVQTIYGYAFVDATVNKLRFIQRFDPEDISPLEVGAVVKLLPRYTLTSAEC